MYFHVFPYWKLAFSIAMLVYWRVMGFFKWVFMGWKKNTTYFVHLVVDSFQPIWKIWVTVKLDAGEHLKKNMKPPLIALHLFPQSWWSEQQKLCKMSVPKMVDEFPLPSYSWESNANHFFKPKNMQMDIDSWNHHLRWRGRSRKTKKQKTSKNLGRLVRRTQESSQN